MYDLLVLTFSDDGKFANLENLKSKSGLGDEDWENLLQYSSQVGSRIDLICAFNHYFCRC